MRYKPVYFGEDDEIVGDDRQADRAADFPAPIRADVRVEPLIGGIAAYAALAHAVDRARRFVYLSGWTLEMGERIGSRRWVDLLADAARRCDVRVLITDIDPAGNHARHRINWSAYRELMRLRDRLPKDRRDSLQAMVSLHSLCIDLNAVPRDVFAFAMPELLHALKGARTVVHDHARNMPLLWRNLRKRKQVYVLAPARELDLRVYPATHHQKFAVVDGADAFSGGIDIARPRANPGLWRDVNCRLQGSIVGDLEAAFVERWNRERVRFGRFLRKAHRDLDALGAPEGFALPAPGSLAALAVAPPPEAAASPAGTSLAQMRRTVTRASHHDEDLEPRGGASWPTMASTLLEEPWRTYQRAIASARHFIYIENQYLRETGLGDLIDARLAATPELVALLVTPQRVEEKDKQLTPHGNAKQSRVISALAGKYGKAKRFGAYQIRAMRPYCHSKVMIVDDKFAVIGSANANPRSFALDTELDIAWYDESAVHAFRVRLWRDLLPDLTDDGIGRCPPTEFVTLFDRATHSRSPARLLFRYKALPACRHDGDERCERFNPVLELPIFRGIA